MLVGLLIVSSIIGTPLRVDEALATLGTCDDFRQEGCRFAAAWVKMGGDAVLPKVVAVAPSMTSIGQILTVSVIGGNPSKAATEALGALASDTRLGISARSLALDRLTDRTPAGRAAKGPLKVALALVHDEQPMIRQTAVRLVANHLSAKDKPLIRALLEAVNDQEPAVRAEAVLGFGLGMCKEAPKALAAALGDPDPKVRRAAAEGLARVKYPAVIPDLVALLSPRSDELDLALTRALRFQSGQSFGDDAEQWKRWLAQR